MLTDHTRRAELQDKAIERVERFDVFVAFDTVPALAEAITLPSGSVMLIIVLLKVE